MHSGLSFRGLFTSVLIGKQQREEYDLADREQVHLRRRSHAVILAADSQRGPRL